MMMSTHQPAPLSFLAAAAAKQQQQKQNIFESEIR
jgi:hypothetical protein